MQQIVTKTESVVLLLAWALFAPLLFAEELPELPEAFDAGWKGEKTCELLYQVETVRIGRCTFPPGIGHEKHFHFPHFGYVLEGGILRIADDKGEVEIRHTITGATWSTSEITVHGALNIGETTTSYLIVEPISAVYNSE